MSNSSSSTPSSSIAGSHELDGRPNRTKRWSEPFPSGHDILLFLLAYRILNALVVQTFFQPDEYFQSLEPAWALAFGGGSGAWITWEWKNRLRSAIHPALFALCYRAAAELSALFGLSHNRRAELLLAAPKILQASIAAAGDYYTWKLAKKVYGTRSTAAGAALILSVVSPWQWFCSTRTFSNCLEATLTIVALYNWPWHWSVPSEKGQTPKVDSNGLRVRPTDGLFAGVVDETTRLRRALLCAALATILRPTNVLVWFALILLSILRGGKSKWPDEGPETEQSAFVKLDVVASLPTRAECVVFLREALCCGGAVLLLSITIDRLFYGAWSFPPYNFLYFNVYQSLSIFYGNNDWHYYLSQGYPLLLTTALPFAIIGIYRVLGSSPDIKTLPLASQTTLRDLTIISLFLPMVLSMVSHKEVRFIHPVLPALHIIAAQPISSFFTPVFQQPTLQPNQCRQFKRLILLVLLCLNLLVSLYTTTVHNSGLIRVTHYLRHQFESHYLHNSSPSPDTRAGNFNMTVGFLMPCHSTPWRSYLQYPPTRLSPGIDAWALTCEPPLYLESAEKANYLDEADQFYDDPSIWLKKHMSRHAPSLPNQKANKQHAAGVFGQAQARPRRMFEVETHLEEDLWRERKGRRPWPEYLIFFEHLEPMMQTALRGSGYLECKRIWNSQWHDDWRRTGDVVVWCLSPDRKEESPPTAQGQGNDKRWWWWNRLSHALKGGVPSMREVEASLHDPLNGADGGGQRVLGRRSAQTTTKLPTDRVVEKAFWKQRPAQEPAAATSLDGGEKWWRMILPTGFLSANENSNKETKRKEKQKTEKSSWWDWEGGAWN